MLHSRSVGGKNYYILLSRAVNRFVNGENMALSYKEDGLEACHTCNNPSCVYPGHLYVDDKSGNQLYSSMQGRHGRQKLNESSVRQIRELHARGITQKELAGKFDVHPTSILSLIHI